MVGVGCWYPDAPAPAYLWENVLARRRAFRRMPRGRFSLADYYDEDRGAPDKTYGRQCAVIDGFEFDWVGRRIPRRTYESTDVSHWLALEVALQALSDAGYGPNNLPRDRTGVVVGNTLTGEQSRSQSLRVRWPFVERALRAAAKREGFGDVVTDSLVRSAQSSFTSVFPATDEDTLAGSLSNTIAGRICNYLDLKGGGYVVDAACASSLLAVTTAANVLSNHEIDVALVGGVDVSLDPFELVGFAKVGALSPTEMRVYDRLADGFVPGEGCGFVVLKRLSDARSDDDYVYSVVRGWGVSSDGSGGVTAPSVDGQSLAIKRAYKRAGYSPGEVSFIEGHGTGTPAGDPVEIEAIASALSAYGAREPRSCGLSSFKSIVGHTKAAAGIGGFIKACVAVNRRVVPPTALCETPNEAFERGDRVLYPLREGRVESRDKTMRAGVSAMGFGGINSHVTIESGDAPAARFQPSLDEQALLSSAQRTEVFVLTGNTSEALAKRAEEISRLADGVSCAELTDLAAHVAAEATPDALFRGAIVTGQVDELLSALSECRDIALASDHGAGQVTAIQRRRTCGWIGQRGRHPRIGFLFPGQGSQRVGMASRLVARFAWADDFIDAADQWLCELGLEPVRPFILRPRHRAVDEKQEEEWKQTLRRTEHAQPAICIASALWLKYLSRLGVRPSVVAGHSLGELCALHAAGAFGDRKLIEIAALRGHIMSEQMGDGAMASLSCSREDAERIVATVDGYCIAANLNTPEQTVVSGDAPAVAAVVLAAKERGVHAVRLNVAGAFHSNHFRQARQSLLAQDSIPEFSEPFRVPFVSAVDGMARAAGISVRNYLADQVQAPVDFLSAIRTLGARCDAFVEVGPGRALTGMVSSTLGHAVPSCTPVEGRPGEDRDLNWTVASLFVRGVRIRFDALYENRLVRRFVPASTRVFIGNPCERPFAEDVTRPSPIDVPVKAPEVSANRVTLHQERAPESGDRKVSDSGVVAKATPANVVREAIERQTGFPGESLTDDLRLVDDLHLDSIKILELVSDLADRLGLGTDFDAAQFADATLGELVRGLDAVPAASASLGSIGAILDERSEDERPGRSVANFRVEWEEEPLAQDSDSRLAGHVVIVTDQDDDALATALVRKLEAAGAVAQVHNIRQIASPPKGCEHLVVLGHDVSGPDSVESLQESVDLLVAGAALLPSGGGGGARSVTFVRVRLEGREPRCVFDWSAHGFAAAIHLERKKLRVRAVEFQGIPNDVERMATSVLAEAQTSALFASARYDREWRRSVGRPSRVNPSFYRPRERSVLADDVVLVTGGAKGITTECAYELARKSGASFVLVGSSPESETESSGSGSTVSAALERFRQAGVRCSYHQCDLRDTSQVRSLVGAVRREFGSIDIVVHGAGLNMPRAVDRPTAEEVFKEIGPKVAGALNLFEALSDTPPKMFVALTSIIGITGMPGNAWYAYANQALDRSLAQFRESHPSVDAVAIAYGLWAEVGMGERLGSVGRLAKLGVGAIPVKEGASRFLGLLANDPGVRETIVTAPAGGLDTWRPLERGPRTQFGFVDEVIRLERGRTLVCRTRLSTLSDPYLRDHVYQGSLLFPAVFGLEAMAQAVACVLGADTLPLPLSIEDAEFVLPLVVSAERGLEIEVRVQAQTASAEGVQRVLAEIRCEQTAFEQAHFSACFALGGEGGAEALVETSLSKALPIEPKTDLYGSVLFQGHRFQRIEELYALDGQGCTFTTRRDRSDLLLGDPYVRDTLLQSLQLCVVPDQCLPVRISRWRIHRTRGGEGVCNASACITGKQGDTYVGDVRSRAPDGTVVEALEGYHARAVTTRPEWPSPDRLASTGTRTGGSRSHETAVGDDEPESWDGGRFYRDVPGYGHQGQTAFFCRFPLSAQDSSTVSGSLNPTSFFRWAGRLREWGGMNTPGVYEGILEMLGSNDVMSATNECETRILKMPERSDFIEGRYWMEYVNRGDAGNLFEWWRIPFPTGEPELIAWTRMRISAVRAVRHGVIERADWPGFLYRFLKAMGDDAPEPTRGPSLDLEMGARLYSKDAGPTLGPVLDHLVLATSQEDSNVVGNIYFANYSVWQARVTDRFVHRVSPRSFEGRGAEGELYWANTRINQLRDAMPFDDIQVTMHLDELYERGARLSYAFHRLGEDKGRKIAAGRSLVAWADVNRGAAPVALEWPAELRKAMLERVEERSQRKRSA